MKVISFVNIHGELRIEPRLPEENTDDQPEIKLTLIHPDDDKDILEMWFGLPDAYEIAEAIVQIAQRADPANAPVTAPPVRQ